ncbi:iron ABC transporter substrate-binding protein [Frankia sp. R43]|uniref:ABC transporter substrate-binding protein n=1 Tax=Frankia sp. R43 TaxID=269536 RepID=UPI0006CA2BBB|nr:ABC transporter substrate-binding protein [Frankia sp. R43]KPM55459.1 iron ABC transporter substrate-binding protein [Frankia sp. R43]
MRGRPVFAAGALLLALVVTSCSDDTTGGSANGTTGASTAAAQRAAEGRTTYPLTITNCGRKYTFDKAPSRVVVMNGGSVAEVSSLIELGVSDRIVANAQNYGASDVPGRAEAIDALPTGGVTLNDLQDIPREAMLGLRPDLVISTYGGGFDAASGFATRDDLLKLGANSYVPASACGTDGMTAGAPTIEDSYAILRDFGKIFDVSGKAQEVIAASKDRIGEVTKALAGKPDANVLLVFPGMGADDFSSIAGAGVWNDILDKAGAVNPFLDSSGNTFLTVSKEKLASTDIDAVLVVNYMNPDPDKAAKAILAQFPQWDATRANRYLVLADSIYFGPSNDVAVEKIAKLLHPDTF